MSSDWAIHAEGLSKCYHLYDRPADRLKQMLWRGRRRYFREFWALRDVSFELPHGEVLGIVGSNGAGKSTLLQIVCGTQSQTRGHIKTGGRIAALLELGAGFNSDFSGRENIHLSAAILGLSPDEVAERIEEIIEFSGIRDFVDQPVKTYSSGMYIRLAFAIATSVDPDILVIDEALSVGDGAFARKSFDRIMALRARGATILFCSHAMYHIEAICTQALWLRDGRVEMMGPPPHVVSAYTSFLDRVAATTPTTPLHAAPAGGTGTARIAGLRVEADGSTGRTLELHSGRSTLSVTVDFSSDPVLPCPTLAVGIVSASGIVIASAGSHNDGAPLQRGAGGAGCGRVTFPDLPLLKGDYYVSAFLLCEQGIHVYDHAERYALLRVSQAGLEQGVVSLPHRWD
jgi:lipopolysaccharide transport system ATP-binding protein